MPANRQVAGESRSCAFPVDSWGSWWVMDVAARPRPFRWGCFPFLDSALWQGLVDRSRCADRRTCAIAPAAPKDLCRPTRPPVIIERVGEVGAGVQGDFNRSSQRLMERSCDGREETGGGSGWAAADDVFAGASAGGAAGAASAVSAIACGVSSEEAAAEAGVSAAVGVRWFRDGGGMPSVPDISQPPRCRAVIAPGGEPVLTPWGYGTPALADVPRDVPKRSEGSRSGPAKRVWVPRLPPITSTCSRMPVSPRLEPVSDRVRSVVLPQSRTSMSTVTSSAVLASCCHYRG